MTYMGWPPIALVANRLAVNLICNSGMKANTQRAQRQQVALSGRVTWKDSRGMTRFASVVTRDVSETGVFIEWREPTSIPLYRLVSFQLERDARSRHGLPLALQNGGAQPFIARHLPWSTAHLTDTHPPPDPARAHTTTLQTIEAAA